MHIASQTNIVLEVITYCAASCYLGLIQREVNGPCSFGLLNANENTIYLWKLSV